MSEKPSAEVLKRLVLFCIKANKPESLEHLKAIHEETNPDMPGEIIEAAWKEHNER